LIIGKPVNTSFTLDGTSTLNTVSSVRSLGITIEHDLNFKSHIQDIVSKAKRTASLIFRCFYSKHIHLLLKAFVVYVRPLVEYSTQIWSPHTVQLITLIEDVQRSFTRRLPGLTDLSYEERLVNLNIQSLEHRRLIADLTLCYKIVHGLIDLDFDEFFKFSNISTHRGHKFKLAVPVAKCNRTKYFFSSRVVPTWNSLPDDVVVAPTLLAFKKRVRKLDFSKILLMPCNFSLS